MGGQLGTLAQGHGLAAMLVDDGFEAVGHIIQGLVPTGTAPFARAPGPVADHRGLEPLGVVKKRNARRPPGTETALHAGHAGVALDPFDLPVLDHHLDGATHRTHETEAVNRFFHDQTP